MRRGTRHLIRVIVARLRGESSSRNLQVGMMWIAGTWIWIRECIAIGCARTNHRRESLACQERFKVWKQLAEQHGPVNSELWDIDRIFPFTDTAVGLASRYEYG